MDGDKVHVVVGGDKLSESVNTLMNFGVPLEAGNLLRHLRLPASKHCVRFINMVS